MPRLTIRPRRREGRPEPEATRQIERRENAQHDEREDAEELPPDPRARVASDEPDPIVNRVRGGEVNSRPDREHEPHDRERHDKRRQNAQSQITL